MGLDIQYHQLFCAHHAFALISSTSSPRLWSSLTRTLKDSGSPGSRNGSPLTIASYIRERPGTSSDLTVSNTCRVYAVPYPSEANPSSFLNPMTQNLTLSDISCEAKNY